MSRLVFRSNWVNGDGTLYREGSSPDGLDDRYITRLIELDVLERREDEPTPKKEEIKEKSFEAPPVNKMVQKPVKKKKGKRGRPKKKGRPKGSKNKVKK